MAVISGGGDGARRAAEDAARRAREEAARRAREAAREAAQDAAQQAAANQRAAAARLATSRRPQFLAADGLDQPADTRLFAPPRPTVAAPNHPTGLPTTPLVRLTGGGLDTAPPAAPPPPDPLTDAQADGLVGVFAAAAEAWATLPPDLQVVSVRPGDGADALVAAWIEGGRAGVGPGDPEAYAAYMSRHEDALRQLADVVSPGDLAASELALLPDRAAFVNRLATPALAALQEQHPEAILRLLAVESGALPIRDLGAFWGENTSQLVIEMNEGGTVEHYALNPYRLLQPTAGANEAVAALSSDDALLESWYESTRDLVPAHLDQGSAAATLDTLDGLHVPEAVLNGVLEMPAEAQADFVQAFGVAAGESAEHPLALLTRVDGITPDEVIVAVDASTLGAPSLETVVNTAAVDHLGKVEAFLAENYETVVAPGFAQYLALRGDAPRGRGGTDLVNEIGTALHLPPDRVPQTAEELALLRQGQWAFYADDARALIDPIAERIDAVAGVCPAQVAVLPVSYYSEQTGIVELPLFRVDVPGGSEVFVDNEGRSYASFEAWRSENRLPPGQFTFPADGHLRPGEEGRALTATAATPRTVDTVREWALQAGDTVALVGGFVVAAAAVVGSGGTLLPVTAAALATWGGARSAGNLIDRAQHGQTLSLADGEARSDWLNLGASALGVAALGSGSLARALARGGSRFAPLAASVARGAYVGAELADGATMVDLTHTLLTNPDLRPEDRLAIVSQLAFWGGMGAIELRGQRGLYSLETAEWHLSTQAALREGRPVLPPESGLTPRFEAAVASALDEIGVDAIGFRGASPGGSFWHDVGGPTQRDSWTVVSNFLADGTPGASGAYVPTKPEGAFTLIDVRPDGTADLTGARALDAHLRQETGVGLLDNFPILEDVILTDGSGTIIGFQPMLGGAKPVVMSPQLQTVTIDGREVRVPVGPVAITVSDFDIAYAVRDGQPLTEQQVRGELIPAINRAYSHLADGGTYDVVNHPDHASGMLDPHLNERYGLSGERYWEAPVYSFDRRGYTGESPLGPTVREVFDLPRDWHGGPRPE